jgi:MoxR-like ATPase
MIYCLSYIFLKQTMSSTPSSQEPSFESGSSNAGSPSEQTDSADVDVPVDQGEQFDDEDLEDIHRLNEAREKLHGELSKNIVGQEDVIEQILITIFSGGHALLVGVPGLAKTLLVRTLAQSLSLDFSRIQFTPDLMPSDVTGTEIIQQDQSTGERKMEFRKGPLFANMVLADEINRTPPKTQAALLEAMQEHQITAGGEQYDLDEPFFVLATQNPIEQEGTYPLPEAQLDRFMLEIRVDYPTEDEEMDVMRLTTTKFDESVSEVLSKDEILEIQKTVRRVPIADSVIKYATKLVRKTRTGTPDAPDFVNEWVSWGAGPRATKYLIIGGKARAMLHGRPYVASEDIQAVAHSVLRHRVITNFSAEAEGISTDDITDKLLESVSPVSRDDAKDERVSEVLRSGGT